MKKIHLLLAATLAVAATAQAQLIEDSFDWGTGVTGRTTITAGNTINGLAPQTGSGTWTFGTNPQGVFAGTAGVGNGTLNVGDTANMAGFLPLTAAGQMTLVSEWTYDPGTTGVRGVWMGFEATSPSHGALNNQTTDNVFMRLANGRVASVGSTVTGFANSGNSAIDFTNGDRVRLTMNIDMGARTGSALFSNLSQSDDATITFSWTQTSVDWTRFALNRTGTTADTVTLDYVSVIPEPGTYGLIGGAFALGVVLLRRPRK